MTLHKGSPYLGPAPNRLDRIEVVYQGPAPPRNLERDILGQQTVMQMAYVSAEGQTYMVPATNSRFFVGRSAAPRFDPPIEHS